MGKLTLLLGGARSGKSRYAQTLAGQAVGGVLYIATATAYDAEMRQRIATHQQERPAGWRTLETPSGVAAVVEGIVRDDDTVVLDCLTMLLSNLLTTPPDEADNTLDFEVDEAAAATVVRRELDALLAAIQDGAAHWIVVTNEVGLGLVPPYTLGRVYRDLLGWANQRLAAIADEVYLLVAGIPLPIHQYRGLT